MAVISETVKPTSLVLSRKKTQGMVTDEFLYFFLRLRIGVIAASGASAATPYLVSQRQWNPLAAISASGVTASLVTQIIGAAIRIYKNKRPSPAAAAW